MVLKYYLLGFLVLSSIQMDPTVTLRPACSTIRPRKKARTVYTLTFLRRPLPQKDLVVRFLSGCMAALSSLELAVCLDMMVLTSLGRLPSFALSIN
jgi:hypothetical protein